jgi:hypothetical protein
MTGVSNVRIKDLIIDGDKGSKGGSNRCIQVTNSTDVVIQNIKLTNSTQCIKIDGGSSECKVLDCELTGIDLHGVYLDNPTTNKIDVRNNLLQCGGFGIYLGDGTYKNNIVGNRCYSNGLELIGVTLNCYGNRVADNHAEGTGDNGISITGYQNTVTGNVSVNNANNGICVYGHSNTVTGNVCANNCQSFGTLGLNFAGIMVNPAWGGQGRDNAISGNVCYDDQVSPTQGYGVRVHTHSYIQWATGVTVASMSSNTYRYYGTNVYKISSSNVGTTTGVTPPTHTSGDASDGAVLWTFLFSASVAGNLDSYHNAAGLNTCYGNRVANDSDGTTNANAGIRPGQVVLPINSPTNFVSRIHTHNGAPAGNIVGGTGDLMLRVGGGTGITAYLKESGTNDSTGWVAIMTRKQGTTANRPTLGSGYEGYIYFDTTLGKPIWFKNPTWVLADGTTA